MPPVGGAASTCRAGRGGGQQGRHCHRGGAGGPLPLLLLLVDAIGAGWLIEAGRQARPCSAMALVVALALLPLLVGLTGAAGVGLGLLVVGGAALLVGHSTDHALGGRWKGQEGACTVLAV